MSSEWIYKNIFNFDEDKIQEIRSEIIDDQKRKFRFEQIEQEGNDPFKTGQSFGTPHDLATLQQSENGEEGEGDNPFGEDVDIPDGGWPGSGRPKDSSNKWKTDKNNFGRDPLGAKALNTPEKLSPKHKYNNSPLSQEQIEDITSGIKRKTKGIISESLTDNEKNSKKWVEKDDKNTILDEKNIKDIE